MFSKIVLVKADKNELKKELKMLKNNLKKVMVGVLSVSVIYIGGCGKAGIVNDISGLKTTPINTVSSNIIVALNQSMMAMNIGDQAGLIAAITPEDVSKNITWTSLDPTKATVSSRVFFMGCGSCS